MCTVGQLGKKLWCSHNVLLRYSCKGIQIELWFYFIDTCTKCPALCAVGRRLARLHIQWEHNGQTCICRSQAGLGHCSCSFCCTSGFLSFCIVSSTWICIRMFFDLYGTFAVWTGALNNILCLKNVLLCHLIWLHYVSTNMHKIWQVKIEAIECT